MALCLEYQNSLMDNKLSTCKIQLIFVKYDWLGNSSAAGVVTQILHFL